MFFSSLLFFLPVDVLLKATGDAPIMKKKKWAVEGEKRVGWVADFIRKYLKLDPSDSLVCSSSPSYLHQGYMEEEYGDKVLP